MKTWTMAEAKSDFGRGLLEGVSICFNEPMGESHYVVLLDCSLSTDGSGDLVDARTGSVRQFKTMDAAHTAIRKIGFHMPRFCGCAK